MKMSVKPQGGLTNLPPHRRSPAPTGWRWAGAWEAFALLGVLALAFGLRTLLPDVHPVWVGGAVSMDAARKTFSGILAFLQSPHAHPIGDYLGLLSAGIRWAGSRLAPTRGLSLLCGMAAVLLTWQVGRRFFSAPIGIVAATLVALNPFQVIASNDIGIDMPFEFLVLASTLLLWRAQQWPGSLWFWAAYGASVALMTRTSSYALLLLPAHALWVFLSQPVNQAIEHLGLAGTVALALYLPWGPHALVLSDPGIPRGQPVQFDYILTMIATQMSGGHLFNSGTYETVGSRLDPRYHLLLLLPFLAVVVGGALALGRVEKLERMLVGLSWTVPVVAIVLISLARGSVTAYPRDLVFIQPFAALFLAAGIIRWRQIFRWRQGVTAAPEADHA